MLYETSNFKFNLEKNLVPVLLTPPFPEQSLNSSLESHFGLGFLPPFLWSTREADERSQAVQFIHFVLSGKISESLHATVATPRLRTYMCCCCPNIHRHQIHLISYGCVSFFLISTGLVFTVFAIFQKDSQIGKVWLAGPTTMVVGLVLCGKVIIDWGPAMMHAREGSIDSRLMDHMSRAGPHIPRVNEISLRQSVQYKYEHEPKCNGTTKLPYIPGHHISNGHASSPVNSPLPRHVQYPREAPRETQDLYQDVQSCLIYSQYDPNLNNINGVPSVNRMSISSPAHTSHHTSRHSITTTANSPNSSAEICDCSKYGSMRRHGAAPFQGESFVLNERSYLI